MSNIQKYIPPVLLCDAPREGISYAGRERVHRVEFINWKDYTICNVEIDGTWHTCSFPRDTTIVEFLLAGTISSAGFWPKGRIYKQEE